MSNERKPAIVSIANDVMATFAKIPMGTANAVEMAAEKGYDIGKYHGRKEVLAIVTKTEGDRAEGFAAGLTRARDLLAAHADESEALARGQAVAAEQAQTRAAASATRAAVQRSGVALLDREIAALKGEGK